jgi:hypothetical protein
LAKVDLAVITSLVEESSLRHASRVDRFPTKIQKFFQDESLYRFGTRSVGGIFAIAPELCPKMFGRRAIQQIRTLHSQTVGPEGMPMIHNPMEKLGLYSALS